VAADGTDIMPPAMGQPINVVEKPSRTPGIARFEINRSLTGMGHERYASAEDIVDHRAVDELARRLFATGGVTRVHVNSSVITVALADGWAGDQLLDVIRGLYIYYPAADDPAAIQSRYVEILPAERDASPWRTAMWDAIKAFMVSGSHERFAAFLLQTRVVRKVPIRVLAAAVAEVEG